MAFGIEVEADIEAALAFELEAPAFAVELGADIVEALAASEDMFEPAVVLPFSGLQSPAVFVASFLSAEPASLPAEAGHSFELLLNVTSLFYNQRLHRNGHTVRHRCRAVCLCLCH